MAAGARRTARRYTALIALCALLLFIAVLENGAPMVTELSVPCAGLPEGFEGFRIAQVSDLHNAVPSGGNDALLALLAQSAPDLIAITGDLIDSRRPDVAAALAFVQEAVRIARLARELGCGDFVKIEIMRDSKYLLPDNAETIKATEALAKEGFVVLPYMYPLSLIHI